VASRPMTASAEVDAGNAPTMRVDGAASGLRFALPGGGHALFTIRTHGNLSTTRGPGHECGRRERDRLCRDLGLSWLCASRQVHGTTVQRLRETGGRGADALAIDADGHATALRGVGAMVLVADCLPVVLGARGAVAAVHAGWRGLAGGVIEEGVRALRELGGEGELAAVIGPGAGPCCYEVGPEVHAAFGDRAAAGGAAGSGSRQGRAAGSGLRQGPAVGAGGFQQVRAVGAGGSQHEVGAGGSQQSVGRHREGRNIDLPALARERLLAAGVQRVESVGVCTICDERCFSHRREGLRAGRQAGIAWLG
jgi:YfiH family protein